MIFGFRIKGSAEDPGDRASRLLREATSLKKKGRHDEACQSLREAYAAIRETSTDYTIDPFLRLPMYLQAGGKTDEAWREFNNLLTSGYPNMPRTEWLWHMTEARIFDKMRLFLQRQKKPAPAVVFGTKAFVKEVRSELKKPSDIRDSEFLKTAKAAETLSEVLTPLLKKAKKADRVDEAVGVLREWINQLPTVDDMEYEKRIEKIVVS